MSVSHYSHEELKKEARRMAKQARMKSYSWEVTVSNSGASLNVHGKDSEDKPVSTGMAL